jgi:type VI secretion system protein ImpK
MIGQLFRSGSDVLEPGRQALFERIARAVAQEHGAIRIEGHADSDPVTSLAFPDNQALSDARAQAVATVFRGLLPDPKRVSSQGFGATRPIATNATAAGKALNRRVEIVVPRTE